jgi:hypothetical protein
METFVGLIAIIIMAAAAIGGFELGWWLGEKHENWRDRK